MRVIKTLAKQVELAEAGRLFIIVNCTYLKVSPADVHAMQGVKFYAKVTK
jgi:hypothetical protein